MYQLARVRRSLLDQGIKADALGPTIIVLITRSIWTTDKALTSWFGFKSSQGQNYVSVKSYNKQEKQTFQQRQLQLRAADRRIWEKAEALTTMPLITVQHWLQHGIFQWSCPSPFPSHPRLYQSDPPADASLRISKDSQLWLVFMPLSF